MTSIAQSSRKLLATVIAAVAALFAGMPGAVACVGCRVAGEAVQKAEPQTVTAGLAFSWSVLFMLAVVGVLLCFMIGYIARTCAEIDRRNQS